MSVNDDLQAGLIVAVGDGLYRKCRDCGEIVRINKPFIGALHFCVEEKPRADL